MNKSYESYGRYKYARDSAWQVLIDYNINSLPINVISIATGAGIKILKNSIVQKLTNGEIGTSVLRGDKWYIIYDDTMSKERARFTIAHELGHIFLGHPLKGGHHARTINTDKPQIETEADIFASRLLAPACVLLGLDLHTPEEIKEACEISYQAAELRANRMRELYKRNKFLTSPLERRVYNNFTDYIKQNKE
ncbi:MAG: ImmA/IrrE family metallo-endopeptidase [Oscillospiraceae bacterium]|nr:ImmA/IrrE family metallo-endopeptidase [Oscillospiraceae bacterium]